MFYYLSFLRPPPSQAAPFGNLLVTPQIANDLRTELFDGASDVFFSWTHENGSVGNGAGFETKFAKLTTWRQSSAYKEIPVPLPPNVREGQTWRLCLSCSPGGGLKTAHKQNGMVESSVIALHTPNVGLVPFPVLSMPILFEARGSKGATKQEKIERIYQVLPKHGQNTGTPVLSDLKITEQTSFDLDKKVWDSGIGLSSWLSELYQSNDLETHTSPAKVRDAIFGVGPRNILELGAGTGIVALTLAVLRSSMKALDNSEEQADCIYTTDVASAMPLLEHNIAQNLHLYAQNSPLAEVLDWDDDDLPDYTKVLPSGLDVIVMADVTYNTSSFPSLVRTLAALSRVGLNPPIFIMGYKERDSAERTLWEMTKQVGIKFEQVGERKGGGGAPVEIWLGRSENSI